MIDLSRHFSVQPCDQGFLIRQDCVDDDGDVTDDTITVALSDFDDVLRFLAGVVGYDVNAWPDSEAA